MDRCDVLIVGGGPAGSSLAWSLRDQSLDVRVLDRARFPRDKVCAGWITPAVVRSLQIDLADYSKDRVLQPIHRFGVGLQGRRQVRTPRSSQPISYGILRREFDHYLLDRSQASLLLGQPLSSLKRAGRDWIVNGEIVSRLVVGAGGHFCPVARSLLSGPTRPKPLIAAQEIEFEMTPDQSAACTIDPEVPELFFCQDLRGYGWVFRKGEHLNVGLGREDRHRLPAHVSRFRRFLLDSGKVPTGTPSRWRGHAYRLYRRGRRQVTGDGVLLVGDAAELAYPESGEGIRPAIESGLLAAEVIVAARGDYRRGRLAAYEKALERRFGSRETSPGTDNQLSLSLKTFVARRLIEQEWFARHVVVGRWFLRHHVQDIPASRQTTVVASSAA